MTVLARISTPSASPSSFPKMILLPCAPHGGPTMKSSMVGCSHDPHRRRARRHHALRQHAADLGRTHRGAAMSKQYDERDRRFIQFLEGLTKEELESRYRQCRTKAEITWENQQYNEAQGPHFNPSGWR